MEGQSPVTRKPTTGHAALLGLKQPRHRHVRFHRYQQVWLPSLSGQKEVYKQMDSCGEKTQNPKQKAHACNTQSPFTALQNAAPSSVLLSSIQTAPPPPKTQLRICTSPVREKHLQEKRKGGGGNQCSGGPKPLPRHPVKPIISPFWVLIRCFPFYSNKATSKSGVCWKHMHFSPFSCTSACPLSGSLSGCQLCLWHSR